MAKPIAIIYFPEEFYVGSGRRDWIYQYMHQLNGEPDATTAIKPERKDYYTDYYWFCFYKGGITEPELKVFHEKDWTEIQQNELKQLIIKSINEQKHGN